MVFIAGFCLILTMTPAHADTVGSAQGAKKNTALAPGYSELDFPLPEAGTYELPPLGQAGDGNVLNTDASPLRLHDLLGEKITLLSFIYSSCNDVNGCPLATFVLNRTQKRILQDDSLSKEVRFISLSFDPQQDTPEVMGNYGKGFIKKDFDWYFLTTTGEDQLQPLLMSYGQAIQKDLGKDGEETGTISHILRVYLIDKQKRIRNIYSDSFLHPDTLISDIETLLVDQHAAKLTGSEGILATTSKLHGAGDYKGGYDTKDYRTQARSLAGRGGVPADLLKNLQTPPLGLPEVVLPENNPVTEEKVALGRKLFFDRRLSHNNTISCAMCHVPEQGFGSNELATAVGIEGRTVRRNSPTMYNVAYMKRLFHDAREHSLEQQIWNPLLAHNEMANPSVGMVIEKLKSLPDYEGRFEQAFAQGLSMETVGMAIASYERVLVSANSPFDRWYFGKEKNAVPQAAKRGFELFRGKANCIACHRIEKDYALFTDHGLHNTGIGYRASMGSGDDSLQVLIAPGTYINVDRAAVAESAERTPNDLGYYEITQDPEDRWKYRTPGLRNIVLTGPYMHDGSLKDLREVLAFYNRGGVANELLDPLIRPLDLNDDEISDLLAFLHTLTGDNIDTLISDAHTQEVGNTK